MLTFHCISKITYLSDTFKCAHKQRTLKQINVIMKLFMKV